MARVAERVNHTATHTVNTRHCAVSAAQVCSAATAAAAASSCNDSYCRAESRCQQGERKESR